MSLSVGSPTPGEQSPPADSVVPPHPSTARFSLLTRVILALVVFSGLWLSVIPPEGGRALQLALGATAAVAAVASKWVPLSGTLIAGIATAAAWILGLTVDPFLLAGISIVTIAERQGRRRFPIWILISGAILALATLTVQVGPDSPSREATWRGILLSAIVVAGAWAIGVRTRQLREQAAEQARTVERLRVARDVHDVLSHSLSTIGVQAGVAAHVEALSVAELRDTLRGIETQSRDSLRELHTLLHHERSGAGSDAGSGENSPRDRPQGSPPSLTVLLGDLAVSARASGLRVVLEAKDEALDRLPADAQTTIHRIAQEATTNTIRHANATTLTISVIPGAGSVDVIITDDGIGAHNVAGTSTDDRAAAKPREGHGITGMRERVALLGGTLEVDGSGGFVVRASIPVDDPERSVQ